MKKNFRRWIAFMLIACTMVTVAVLPSYASSYYCFYYEKYDSVDSYFCHQFYIRHTGTLFHEGYTEGMMWTADEVPTTRAMYMNLSLYVRYENGVTDYEKTFRRWGYLEGNTQYTYKQLDDDVTLDFIAEYTPDYVTSSASLATRESTSPSATLPIGYTSPITGETYSNTIEKTREEFYEHGDDYLYD